MGCNTSDILGTAYRNGYAKLSERDLKVAAIAAACSSCNAQPLIELSVGDGYLKLSEFDTAMCIAEALCSSPGATAAPAPTILKMAIQDHLTAMSRRDLDAVITAVLCKQTNPPCVTPTAPTSAGFKTKTNTTISISWSQPANTGSLITGYTISWGTVTGVYTNSATVGASPRLYTITGLTQGTQYFWVVKANSAAAVGCSSVNSAESNTTTNGAPPGPPNHLLTGLIGLWQLNELVAGNRADSGPNGLTLTDTDANIPGVANASVANFTEWADFNANAGDAARGLRHADAAILNPAGSFSFSVWVYLKVKVANSAIIGKWGAGPPFGAVIFSGATGDIAVMDVYDTANTANTANSQTGLFAPMNVNTPYLICGGYDAPGQFIWITFNGAAKYQVAMGANPFAPTANPFAIGNYGSTTNLPMNANMGQSGYWSKTLDATDISALYNGGAGLPFNQFLV